MADARPATAAAPSVVSGGRKAVGPTCTAMPAMRCLATPGRCIAVHCYAAHGSPRLAAMRHEAVGLACSRAAIGAATGWPGLAPIYDGLPAAGGAGHQQGYTTIRDYCDRDCNCRDTARLEWGRLGPTGPPPNRRVCQDQRGSPRHIA